MLKFRFGAKHWKQFTTENLKVIAEEREKAKKNPVVREKGKEYSKICRACGKPNNLKQSFCTGCGFNLVDEDIEKMPDNVFMDILTGKLKGTEILFRDELVAGWNDKFGVSPAGNHLDVVTIEPIVDITSLDRSHIPVIKKMFEAGAKEFEKRKIPFLLPNVPLEDQIVAGFNYPVSVPHLHLHMVIGPFKHEKVFQYPRWHSYKKVIQDLEKHNKVILYQDEPNDKEGEEEYQRAMKLHKELGEQQKKIQQSD